MRSVCKRLRQLEEAIVKQRRLIAERTKQKLEPVGERERLAELLAELDDVLRRNALRSAA